MAFFSNREYICSFEQLTFYNQKCYIYVVSLHCMSHKSLQSVFSQDEYVGLGKASGVVARSLVGKSPVSTVKGIGPPGGDKAQDEAQDVVLNGPEVQFNCC